MFIGCGAFTSAGEVPQHLDHYHDHHLHVYPHQVFSPSVYVDVALQKQLEELLNSCYYIPSKEEASQVEVSLCKH